MYTHGKALIAHATRRAVFMAAMLFFAVSSQAQLEIGDNTKLSGSGNIGYGYASSFGNIGPTTTNQSLVGSADFRGYYFHPNFLSFNFRPYYQRTQGDAESQNISRGTGLGGDVGLFSGSRFPGSVTFGKDFMSDTETRFAGMPSLSGNTNSQTFGISWSALVPNWPTLTASFTKSSSSSSLDSVTSSESSSSSKTLNVSSSYQILGFYLNANFNHSNGDFTTPGYIATPVLSSESSGTSYSLSLGHALPLRGSFALAYNHNSSGSGSGDWKTNSYTASNSFMPWRRLTLYQNATYTDNSVAAYALSMLNGVGTYGLRDGAGSHGLSYSTGASYNVVKGLNIGGHYTRTWQSYAGRKYEHSQYGGNLSYNYNQRLLGMLYFGIGVVDTASKLGNNGAGLNANVGLNRRFGRWESSADFNWGQDFQTLSGFTTTSNYSYGGSTRRKLNEDTQFGGSVRLSHSGLVVTEGNGNSSESCSGFLAWKRYHLSGGYSKSDGTAVINRVGELTPVSTASLFTNDFMLFNAQAWNVNANTRVMRKIDLRFTYSNFNSGTAQLGTSKQNFGERYGFSTEYRLRKFQILGAFSRTEQTVSTVVGGPRVVNSIQLSLSRWFNVF